MELEERIIVSRTRGGIGNQLFMYAAAWALANRKGAELILEISQHGFPGERAYGLGPLHLPERVIEAPAINVAGKPIPNYVEPHHHYDPRIDELEPPIALRGYFQSERYFADLEDQIRARFGIREERLSALGAANLSIIRAARNPISLHVRVGDYIEQPLRYPMPTNRYYRQALSVLKKLIGDDITVLVFAEDNDKAVRIFPWLEQFHFFEPNLSNPIEDIWAISACKAHINANSTFSWWGAWLNPDPDKIVICPHLWFGIELANLTTRDLIPRGWLSL